MRIKIRRPDDFHVHLREGEAMEAVAPITAAQFARALVMPNTSAPILTGADATAYAEAIRAATAGTGFEPLMTIKLVRSTTPEMILEARKAGVVAAKFYPEGVTTNSEDGCKTLFEVRDALEAMEECGMVLCLHGETPGDFCMDRERNFLREELLPTTRWYSRLKVVLEHITTADAVGFVSSLPNVAATVTVHHLLLTLDDVIGGSLSPHNFCKPVAKRPEDRRALLGAVVSDNPKFFLGTDSAPHKRHSKECAQGCAGVFSAPAAMPMLAEIFEVNQALDRLEAFTSEYGANFYGLPQNEGTLELESGDFEVPRAVESKHGDEYTPFRAGKRVRWRVVTP